MDNFDNECKRILTKIRETSYAEAFTQLKSLITPGIDYPQLFKIATFFAKISAQSLNLTPIKLAILSTSTVDHLKNILQLYLAKEGFAAELYVAPFGTLYQQVLDPTSEFYAFTPDITWVFTHFRDVKINPIQIGPHTTSNELIKQEIAKFTALWNTIKTYIPI